MLLSIAHDRNATDCVLLWNEWGPKVSRVFLINKVLRAKGDVEPLQDVEGYRVAYSTNVDFQDTCTEEHSHPAAFILDFSPASIRWASEEAKACRRMRGTLVTEASVLRPGRLLAEEVVSSLPYTRTMLDGYLPQHQIRLSRDEVVYPVCLCMSVGPSGLCERFDRLLRCKDIRHLIFQMFTASPTSSEGESFYIMSPLPSESACLCCCSLR
ncbi:hypothetical protein BDR05DRAFT_959384 [Suillus weaverae]|nr:hypothetical protein BDR05DRAFT_959384 [Suillus weaverae]